MLKHSRRMSQADSMRGHLYFIVSQRDLFANMNQDLKAMLEDPQLFEKIAILWAQEDIHTKEVYITSDQRTAADPKDLILNQISRNQS